VTGAVFLLSKEQSKVGKSKVEEWPRNMRNKVLEGRRPLRPRAERPLPLLKKNPTNL
jgi:hypothetical protein